MLLMSTHNICFHGEMRKIITWYPLLSRPMCWYKFTYWMTNSTDPDQLASSLIWICTVCKGRVYPGSAGQGLIIDKVTPFYTKWFSLICYNMVSESSLVAWCAFYGFRAILRRINENPCHTGWIYRLIWVFAGHTSLIVGFLVHWLIFCLERLK